MTRDELVRIVRQSKADTLFANRMRQALGLPPRVPAAAGGHTRDRSAKERRYRNAKRLMRQRHGVRM